MARSRTARRDDRTPETDRVPPQVRTVARGGVEGSRGADVLAVPVAPPAAGDEEPQPRAGTADAAVAYDIDLAAVCTAHRFTGRAGSVLTVPTLALQGPRRADAGEGPGNLPETLLLVGVGDGGARALRRAGAGLARAARGHEHLATTVAADLAPTGRQAFVEGLLLGAYAPPRTGVGKGPDRAPGLVDLLGSPDDAALEHARASAQATWTVRDLANTPSSVKDPTWVADQARSLASGVPGVEVEVLDAAALAAAGFGGTVAVGSGSSRPPCLVQVTWTPPVSTRSRHVVLVGKGITYDTGGLSIKPREAMVPMKTDMAGAAVVLAVVLAAARTGVTHRVTALLPLAENAVSGSAYRPGDVVTVYGGTTVEVANTDAEGRMVLADALAYADEVLDPDVLLDVATLTGAASLGLGRRHAALYTADDRLAAGLEAAAETTGERVWRMPLVEEYRASIDSEIADVRHVPAKPPGGGSITAALFLREFVGTRRWAHLDIAGPGRAEKDEHEVTKGASGYGARLLLRWLTTLR